MFQAESNMADNDLMIKMLSVAEAKYKAACNRVIDAKVTQWKGSKVTGSRAPTQLIDTLTLYAYSEDSLPLDEKADDAVMIYLESFLEETSIDREEWEQVRNKYPNGAVIAYNHKELVIKDKLNGHEQMQAMSFCQLADGRLVSAGTYDDPTICIWNLTTGQCLQQLHGHRGHIFALLQLKDGRLLSGASDGFIKIWDSVIVAKEDKCEDADKLYYITSWFIERNDTESHWMLRMVEVQNQNQIICCSFDNLVILDSISGQSVQNISFYEMMISSVQLLDNQQGLLLSHDDGMSLLMESNQGKYRCVEELSVGCEVSTTTLLSNGHIAIAFQYHSTAKKAYPYNIKIYNIASNQTVMRLDVQSYKDIHCIVELNHRVIACDCNYKDIQLWDIISGVCFQTITGDHPRVIGRIQLAKLNDGRLVSTHIKQDESNCLLIWG